MPVQTERLYKPTRINIAFVVSAVLLALTSLWMIIDDYDRPWKGHQGAYAQAQAALAQLQYLVTQQDSFQQQIAAARRRVDDTKDSVDPKQNPQYAELVARQNDLKARLYNLDLTFKQKDAHIVVTRGDYEKAAAVSGAESAEAEATRRQLAEQEEALTASRVDKEQVEDQLKQVRREIRDVREDYLAATKELDTLLKQVTEAEAKQAHYSSRLRKTIFNLPLFDFTAPKGTAGRHEIKQVVAHDVKRKLNFMDGYKIDRCITCHVTIDDQEFSQNNLVARFEAAIPAIQEQLVKEGNPAAPRVHMPDPPEVFGWSANQLRGRSAGHWAEVASPDRKAYFDQLQEQVNAYLRYAGMPELNLRQPLQAHPDLDLYLSSDSPHPMSTMGCTVCHEGNGQSTDFMLAAHTPKSHAEQDAWTAEYYDRNLGVPTMTWSTLEHYWDFPMIPPAYAEASCAKCHQQIDDIATFAGRTYGKKIKQGQKLFKQLGCINCHKVAGIEDNRRVGTDLTYVDAKLTEGFIQKWVYNPAAFRPSTLMPHFFMQENNGPASESRFDPNPELRTQTEVMGMTQYLQTVSRPWQPEAIPAGLSGNVADGQKLFGEVGCLACHGNLHEHGQRWIVADLVQRKKWAEPARLELDTLQAKFDALEDRFATARAAAGDPAQLEDLSIEREVLKTKIGNLEQRLEALQEGYADQAQQQFAGMDLNAQAIYAVVNFTEERHRQAQEIAAAEELRAVAERRDPDPLLLYMPPVFTRFAPELSGTGTKVSRQWLYSWLRNPRHYSSYTKMPSLRLCEQEAVDLAEYLLTLKHDTFDATPFERTAEVEAELERRLDDLLLGQNSVATVEKLKRDEDGALAARLVSAMSKDPDPRRQEQKSALYQAAISSMDLAQRQLLFVGQKMITHYGCYACHTIAGFEEAARPGTELTEWGVKNMHQIDFAFFGPAWHHDMGHRPEFQRLYPQERQDLIGWSLSGNQDIDVTHSHASFATHKLLNPRIWDREKLKKPYEKLKMPNFYLTADEIDALVTYMLSRRPPRVGESLAINYDNTSGGPIATGRNLVQELNCIGCHKIENNIATMHQFITVADGGGEEGFDDFDEWGDEEEDELEGEEEDWATGDDTPDASGTLGDRYGGAFDVVNGPPWLRGEGAKVQPAWFHRFLLNVETLRPWEALRVRMPSFYLDNDQAGAIVDYFAHLALKESQDLKMDLRPIHKAVAAAHDELARQRWYAQAHLRGVARVLSDYAVKNEVLKPNYFDFTNKSPEDTDTLFGRVLATAEFFEDLYSISYPFEYDDYTSMDPARFARGEALFHELQCLSCHVLGDPNAPGSNADPSAPNLALTHQRLRYDWFLQWLQEPGWIQPGTKMPQWFPGGRSAYAEYADDVRGPFEEQYSSSGQTQMHLLMDFIWQAGLTNYTAVDPSKMPRKPEPVARGQPRVTKVMPAAAAPDQVMTGQTPATAPQPMTVAADVPVQTYVLSGTITNQASTGPRPSEGPTTVFHAGQVRGQVLWRGGSTPDHHLPVAENHRQACAPNSDSKPLQRLTVNAQTQGVGGAVVYLAGRVKGVPAYPPAAQSPTLTIDQCQFTSRVMVARRGAVLRLVNNDALVHNIQGRMDGTLIWSKNLAADGAHVDFTLDRVGIVEVRSGSGYEWMSSYVWVVDHACFAVTDEQGRFELNQVPPGDYTLHAWHPGIELDTSTGGEPLVQFGAPRVVGGNIEVVGRNTTEAILELK